jgi:hypothetical protein
MKKDLVPGALVLARGIGEQQKLVVVISSMRHAFGADLEGLAFCTVVSDKGHNIYTGFSSGSWWFDWKHDIVVLPPSEGV